MPLDKGKTNWVCPDCGGWKYRYSEKCRECHFKGATKNADSRWQRGKDKDPNYDKVLCPICKTNYKTRNAEMCWDCGIEKRLAGREGKQYCARCGDVLTSKNWSKSRRKYWQRTCTKCDDKSKSERRDTVNEKSRDKNLLLKREMIQEYGGKCQCCGERTEAFLTIDHIDGRGKEHAIKVKSKDGKSSYRLVGSLLYGWLKKNGWPKDNYQLMCMNCNFAKSHNPGGCPHEIERQKLAQQTVQS